MEYELVSIIIWSVTENDLFCVRDSVVVLY